MYKIIEHNEIAKYPSFTLYEDKIQTEDGIINRQVVDRVDAAAVFPILPNGDILMCWQYRHGIKQDLLEIPCGKIDIGETPEEGGIRELYEEVGVKVNKLNHLSDIYPSPGVISEKIYIYMVEISEDDIGAQHLDQDEKINVIRIPIDKLIEKIKNNEIQDAKTIVATTTYLLQKKYIL